MRLCPHIAGLRGRLAPSPTGRIHLGNAFAFCMAYSHVRQQKGVLAMRMEDIDPDRSLKAFAQDIINDLHWLGIDWDEGPGSPQPEAPCPPYWQGQALPLYEAALDHLRTLGLVYPCFCTRKELRSLASAPHNEDGSSVYNGRCRHLALEQVNSSLNEGRHYSLRLNVDKAVAYCLACLGKEVNGLDTNDLEGIARAGDFALMRSDGVPAYQLAVVVDDGRMNITEVVRGNDLQDSTPRQKLLFSLLGYTPPKYYHVPLVCNAQGERLAKRHKSLEIAELRAKGVHPATLVGFLAHLAGFVASPAPMTMEGFTSVATMAVLQQKVLLLPPNVEELLSE